MKILFAAALVTVTATSAFAHGGGLNSQGCHNQNSNGTYHCHRTQSAPQQQAHRQQHNDINDAVLGVIGAVLLLNLLDNDHGHTGSAATFGGYKDGQLYAPAHQCASVREYAEDQGDRWKITTVETCHDTVRNVRYQYK